MPLFRVTKSFVTRRGNRHAPRHGTGPEWKI
jgi:hypothetical protein